MSSGAYLFELPMVLIGGAVMAVGALGGAALRATGVVAGAAGAAGRAAGDAMGNAGDALRGESNGLWQIAEESRRRQMELALQRGYLEAEVQRVQEVVDAVLADISQFGESLRTLNFEYSAQTVTFTQREEGVSTEVAPAMNLGDLMFMEVDVQTRQITYVVLDYSEAISMQSAKNSAQFKKLALASDLMKKIMVWVVDDPATQEKLNQLIGVVNEMLDDHSVSFSHFRQFVEMRFAEFQRLQAAMEVDPEIWERYCALCAMRGERPRRLSQDAVMAQIQTLMEETAADKYVAAARQAFRETVLEMGLQIQSDHMLDQVPGMLLVDGENPGYNLFVSEHDVSLMLEMVDTGEAPAEDRARQYASICKKRREIEKRMQEKGYRLKLCISDDHSCVAVSAVEEKKDERRSRAEQLRRRRALAGKQAKLKMAGGR